MARLELRIAKLERKHDEDAGEYSLAFDWPHDEKGITSFQREVAAALETGAKVYVIGGKGPTPEGVIRLSSSEAYKRAINGQPPYQCKPVSGQAPAISAREAWAMALEALTA